MKKRNYITGIFFAICHLCLGQTNGMPADTFVLRHFKYLYIVQFSDRPPVATENVFIDPLKIENIDRLPDVQCSAICQLLKIDGVVVFKMRPDTKVLTLNEVFNIYKIPAKYRTLSVRIDDEMINDPETTLISLNEIGRIQILKSLKTYYINITSKDYDNDKPELEKAKKTGLLNVN